ncbi:MAG: cytochrome c biogenesis protein CcsA, partial [Bacteroidales bacterium]
TFVKAQEMPVPSKEQAAAFGNIWVQGREGRFKPMHTMSNEVVRKVLKKSSYQGNDANQVMMGMFLYPDEWKQARIFKVDNPEVHQLIGYKGTEVSFNDFISDGRYVLSQLVNSAYTKQVQERTETDKDIMKLDEKINIFYMVQTGALFKIFPDPDVEDGSWHSVADLHSAGHEKNDTLGQVFLLYTKALREGDSELAEEIVEFIGKYQETRSPHALDQRKKRAEVFYNKVDLFNRLSRFYGLFGITLLVFQFMRIFKPRRWINVAFKIGVIHLAVAFVLHTVFLLLRWYISGHAPMSNGYESMLFVSFVTMLAGLVFSGKSGFAISLTAILASLSLSVAHMSWMNPEITNLVPVLKSPWLSIHVTVIISGYGFLGLSMLMGLINLVFYSLLKESNKERISHVLREVTRVNQMSVIIGLYLLTVGTFLGGVWANESWGRYWGWDPKETWALISVLVYSFIVHMHMFPGMKSTFSFNLATVFGYFSILMTYFGVNYFLGGIHSYAAGDAFAIPTWVYVTVLLVMTLSLIAYSRHKLLPGNLLKQ